MVVIVKCLGDQENVTVTIRVALVFEDGAGALWNVRYRRRNSIYMSWKDVVIVKGN